MIPCLANLNMTDMEGRSRLGLYWLSTTIKLQCSMCRLGLSSRPEVSLPVDQHNLPSIMSVCLEKERSIANKTSDGTTVFCGLR